MIDSNGKETVTVKKDELLKELRVNRDTHAADYETALQGWRVDIIDTLSKALSEAVAGTAYQNQVYIKPLSCHTKDYDRVIKMVEMSVGDTVTLTNQDFAQYVMDDWVWKAEFAASTSKYLGK